MIDKSGHGGSHLHLVSASRSRNPAFSSNTQRPPYMHSSRGRPLKGTSPGITTRTESLGCNFTSRESQLIVLGAAPWFRVPGRHGLPVDWLCSVGLLRVMLNLANAQGTKKQSLIAILHAQIFRGRQQCERALFEKCEVRSESFLIFVRQPKIT